MKILVVDHHMESSLLLSHTLTQEHFEVCLENDGAQALAKALAGGLDAMIIDTCVPSLNGISLVESLRQQGSMLPVIMLSRLRTADVCVRALDAGADDFVEQPPVMPALLARLRSLLRRHFRVRAPVLAVADLTFDTGTREARRGGRRLTLSTRETLLLEHLLQAEGRVVTREEIVTNIWEYDFDTNSNLVEVYVARLRAKVDRPFKVRIIHTVRGQGYALRLKQAAPTSQQVAAEAVAQRETAVMAGC